MTTQRLLYPGTLVTATLSGHTAYGEVDEYEHYHPNQSTFPVKFSGLTRIMTANEVIMLPDNQQPPGRQPPRHTGYYEHQNCLSCGTA